MHSLKQLSVIAKRLNLVGERHFGQKKPPTNAFPTFFKPSQRGLFSSFYESHTRLLVKIQKTTAEAKELAKSTFYKELAKNEEKDRKGITMLEVACQPSLQLTDPLEHEAPRCTEVDGYLD